MFLVKKGSRTFFRPKLRILPVGPLLISGGGPVIRAYKLRILHLTGNWMRTWGFGQKGSRPFFLTEQMPSVQASLAMKSKSEAKEKENSCLVSRTCGSNAR